MTTPDPSLAGHAVYTKAVLGIYDVLVHGISNPLVWKCPTRQLQALYRRHLTGSHMDVGVGTGYFLDRCGLPASPSSPPRLALVDANPNSLEVAARRLRRYGPEIHRRNVLEPLNLQGPPFDSIGLMYLLHCLPGDLAAKAAVFDHLNAHLSTGGVVFGATILAGGVETSRSARKLMDVYNAKGIFSNLADRLDVLGAVLETRYAEVDVDVVGCVALFSARRPRRASRGGPQPGGSAGEDPG